MKALERGPPILSFAYGALLVALPDVQYVYFLGAIGVLSATDANLATQVAGLAMFCALVQAMLLVPVVAFARYHDSAAAKLTAIKDWLAKNGSRVTAALLGMFSVYALVLGLLAFGD